MNRKTQIVKKSTTKNHYTSYKLNTAILLVITILFAALTVFGVNRASNIKKGLMQVISDAPSLCYDEENYKNMHTIEDAYVCLLQSDEYGNPSIASTQHDFTLFLQDTIMFSREVEILYFKNLIGYIGAFFTISSLSATIIYWLHNKNQ